MATAKTINTPTKPQQTGYVRAMIIIGALFFIMGFITWVNAVLIPYLKIACELTNFESYLITFAFYVAYLFMAVPSAWVLKITGFKKGMGVSLLVMAVGVLLFIPAALTRTFGLFLFAQFVIGTGLAILQTAVNPYATILGPRESAAKRISIMGICNKIAGAIAPIILGAITLSNADEIVERIKSMDPVQKAVELDALAARVIPPYLAIMGVLVVLAVLIFMSGLPEIDTDNEEEGTMATAKSRKNSVFQFPHLILGVCTLFFYVGAEVIAGDTIISYGASQGIAFATAKFFTTCTLVAMIVGYFIGVTTIPKYLSQEKALKLSAILGLILSLAAIFTHGYISVLCIALLGLANSLVWPAVWPLALADLGRFTKIAASFLVMAIAGGALLPLAYGALVDIFNAQQAYWLLIPCYLFILYFAVSGHKIRT